MEEMHSHCPSWDSSNDGHLLSIQGSSGAESFIYFNNFLG